MHYDDVWAERKSKKEPLYDRIKDRESLITFRGWEQGSTGSARTNFFGPWIPGWGARRRMNSHMTFERGRTNLKKQITTYAHAKPSYHTFKYLFVVGQTRQDMMEKRHKASQDKVVESGSKSLEEHREEFDWLK